MERLQKWFGGNDAQSSALGGLKGNSVTMPPKDSTMASSDQTDATSENMKLKERTADKTSTKPLESQQTDVSSDARVTETRVGQLLDQGRNLILRVVPLREGDCLSCKLIGSGAMWGAAAFVLFSYPKVKTRYTGFKRKLCAVQVGSLATTLTLLGVARFFDLSIFGPEGADGNRKSFGQLITEDLESVQKYSSRLFSTNNKSESKQDS